MQYVKWTALKNKSKLLSQDPYIMKERQVTDYQSKHLYSEKEEKICKTISAIIIQFIPIKAPIEFSGLKKILELKMRIILTKN